MKIVGVVSICVGVASVIFLRLLMVEAAGSLHPRVRSAFIGVALLVYVFVSPPSSRPKP